MSRAHALLPTLWAHGERTWKTEQTNGRWITYEARMLNGKKGVVAYRERAPSTAEPEPIRMSTMPVSRPQPKPVRTAPRPAPAPPAPAPAPKSPVALRTLRRGAKGEDVRAVQNRLNALGHSVGTADGDFGPATERGVRSFQASKGLLVDGVVGKDTYGALFG